MFLIVDSYTIRNHLCSNFHAGNFCYVNVLLPVQAAISLFHLLKHFRLHAERQAITVNILCPSHVYAKKPAVSDAKNLQWNVSSHKARRFQTVITSLMTRYEVSSDEQKSLIRVAVKQFVVYVKTDKYGQHKHTFKKTTTLSRLVHPNIFVKILDLTCTKLNTKKIFTRHQCRNITA